MARYTCSRHRPRDALPPRSRAGGGDRGLGGVEPVAVRSLRPSGHLRCRRVAREGSDQRLTSPRLPQGHLCPHPDLPRPYLPLASPMHPHLCVGPKGAPHRSLAWPQPRPLSASWPRAKAEAEAAHAAIDPPVGYREGGSRVGSLTEVRAVRAPQVNEFLATRKRWRRS